MNAYAGLILLAFLIPAAVPVGRLLVQDFNAAVRWMRANPLKENEMQKIKIAINYNTYILLDATSANLGVATALLDAEVANTEYYDDYAKNCLVVCDNPIKVEVGSFDVFDHVPYNHVALLEAAE